MYIGIRLPRWLAKFLPARTSTTSAGGGLVVTPPTSNPSPDRKTSFAGPTHAGASGLSLAPTAETGTNLRSKVHAEPAPGSAYDAAKSSVEHYAALRPEPIDVIEGWGLNYARANSIKYIARAGRKNTEAASEAKDLRKAISYLQREVNRLDGKSSW